MTETEQTQKPTPLMSWLERGCLAAVILGCAAAMSPNCAETASSWPTDSSSKTDRAAGRRGIAPQIAQAHCRAPFHEDETVTAVAVHLHAAQDAGPAALEIPLLEVQTALPAHPEDFCE